MDEGSAAKTTQSAPERASVTRGPAATEPGSIAVSPLSGLQRALGNHRFGRLVQAKLSIGAPGDTYEREADRTVDTVMRMSDPTCGPAPPVETPPPKVSSIQRACAQCEEEQLIQAKETAGRAPLLSPAVESGVNALRSGGEPLPEYSRRFFEPRFQRDFSDVRIHTGPEASESARSVNALAYTVGRDI